MHPTGQPDGGGAIAAGVPVLTRTDALRRFLESVPEYVSTVYIADNGADRDRPPYEREWPFDLEVLYLPVDCGIGRCRHDIAAACTEPYLWVGDCDMEIARADDLNVLRRILDAHPELGGVSGWLIEGRAIRSGARDLQVHDGVAIKEAADDRDRVDDPVPHSRFDFIPQAGLFRTAVYEDYSYDPAVRNSEHVDFFLGHKRQTDWAFASTPAVMTIHNRDIDPEYRASDRGSGHVDLDVLAAKWGIHDVQPGARADWATVHDQGLVADAFDLVKQTCPPRVWVPLKRAGKRVGLA